MTDRSDRAMAVVGVAALLPDAPSAEAFWANILASRYSITEVPSDRWRAADYYSADTTAPDKTYSTIGSWVRGFQFDWKRFHVPPRVAEAMDEGQQWAVTVAAQALADYGYPGRPLDLDRTGVVLGGAMGGERHYLTCLRIAFPEYASVLSSVPEFGALPPAVRDAILSHWHERLADTLPAVTEDSMPGELANILAGRVANVLDLRGPNFITDAACASTFAAVDAAMDLLAERHCDAVLTGGVDRNMGASSFVKFCKIGALSATGTRPFGAGADGFVMGEGAALFLLKRLSDAEKAGDRVYAVIRGVGGSSDGKGKGITAPNPRGQRMAVARAWEDAGLDPATASLVEAHGTSTRVGDVVEVESLAHVFGAAPRSSIALGSVKSNLGHLKSAAGAAGLLKAVYAVHEKVLPPTLNARTPNPDIDFAHTPFNVNHEAREWPRSNGDPRRAGVSAYGFGGTNFHVVLEEHVPGLLTRKGKSSVAVGRPSGDGSAPEAPSALGPRVPLRGLLALGGTTTADLQSALETALARAREGSVPSPRLPEPSVLSARERLVVDFGTPAELVERLEKAQRAMGLDTRAAWRSLAGQGVFRGSGERAGKIAFLFPGQGSQYVNMGRALREGEPAVAAVFYEADRILAGVLPRPLSAYVFADLAPGDDGRAAEEELKQTSITQPAVLSLDVALFRLLATFGIHPDVVMGHSLGEYAALVAAGAMPLADALEAAAARGREMTRVSMEDNGRMAAIGAPPEAIAAVLGEVDGYVVAANINSSKQCVIGGATTAVDQASARLEGRGFRVTPLAVSHAFHTRIVAPASAPLRQVLDRLRIGPPRLPVVSNVTGGFYPAEADAVKDLLERQIASPVQWMQGLRTLYEDGVRVFVEVGPKRALTSFVEDVLSAHDDVVALFTDHPKVGGTAAFNQALAGLFAAGVGPGAAAAPLEVTTMRTPETTDSASSAMPVAALLAELLGRLDGRTAKAPHDRNEVPRGSIVISGTGLGLPGVAKAVMDPLNAERILRGEQFVDLVPVEYRRSQADKHITRIVKSEDGSGRFETIDDTADVIKLAARGGTFDLTAEYGVPDKLVEALDRTTQLAMAAGLDALREAGIPLVQTWRRTTTGRFLPDRWLLPEPLRDETGVIFASAFPGLDRFADELTRFHEYDRRRKEQALLEDLRRCTNDPAALAEISRRLAAVSEELAREPYVFDRRFLLRVLTMGHSQFAEYVGARGPNTHVNVACASTPAAIAIAEDWIRGGRCRRVVVVGADDVTGPRLFEWMGAGFVATGAAATDDKVEDAALPFDRRRHGMLLGMGACGLVVESQDALEERGMRGQVEVLSTETRNSARHATRLDVEHIADVMESLVASAERRFGIDRLDMAPQTVFVSHETYTPARGGSASAEVAALRKVFGPVASRVVMANTKGFTGHPMGVGIEDVIAVKMLEHGIVPPVPNFREVDPELGILNLSRGGAYPVRYALHLSAGFGSQIALTLTRRIPGGLDRIDSRATYARWASDVSGQDRPALEVSRRVLRVASSGAPGRAPVASTWRFGLGPVRRAAEGAARPAVSFPMEAIAPPPPVVTVPVAEVAVAPPPAVIAPKAVVASIPAPAVPVENDTRPGAALQGLAAPGRDQVAAKVLAIVAEKTGYPPEMLELDLDLEADLGVDTVKQAETFAAVREAYGIPRQESLKLRDFPTLRHVVGFVRQHRPDLAAAPTSVSADAPTTAVAVENATRPGAALPGLAAPGRDQIELKVMAIVAEKTGYPPEMLELDLDLEADLGVDTVKQAETFAAVREAYGIPRQESLKLRDFPTLRHVVGFVRQHRPDLAAAPTSVSADAPTTAVSVENDTRLGAALPSLAAPSREHIERTVMAIVADKTGYPPEMLELDLDLEADLGVDTVKQAETFAAVREAYAIPRQADLKLRDFPTLRHVVRFVLDRRPDLAAPAPAAASPAVVAHAQAATAIAPVPSEPLPLAGAERVPRRVAVPSLRPPLDLCRPTGVALEGKRVLVVGGMDGAGPALRARLAAAGAEVVALPVASATAEHVRGLSQPDPFTGVLWLPALDPDPPLDAIDLAGFKEATGTRVKNLYETMRVLADQVTAPGTFLVAATRLGGLLGMGATPAASAIGGGVAGFTKAYRRERPLALAKVVDFAPDAGADEIADALLAETLQDPGVVEVGHRGGRRFTVTLDEQPIPPETAALTLGPDSVVVVTGAAGGITSAIVQDLAAASHGTFYLLDLASLPPADDPHVARLREGREILKSALIEEARARGEKPLPPQIERSLFEVERREAALRAVEAVEAAGGRAVYRQTDILDAGAVAAVLGEVRGAHPRIDALVHAAGLEISRDLAAKERPEFDRVFDVKVDGLFNLLAATRGLPIGVLVVFSSVAGRFGNAGQTDYSAANATLAAMASHLRALRPDTRTVAIDWTAWAGIGMATRGSIPKVMEAAGIETLPPETGIPTVRREIAAGSGEIVVAGRLGVLGQEWDETGGLDLARAQAVLAGRTHPFVMLGTVRAARVQGGLEIETTLDPRQQPFLFDHALEGTPLLPGVMATEAFAEAASLLAPDLSVLAVEDERFDKPFKYYRGAPATLHVTVEARPAADGELLVIGRVTSLVQPRPDVAAIEKEHFRARVRMGPEAPQPAALPFAPPEPDQLDIGHDRIYRTYFHGPSYQVLERARVGDDTAIGLMAGGLPPGASPADAAVLVEPRLVELCFQTAGLWEIVREQRMGLPLSLSALRVHRHVCDGERLWAQVQRRPDGAFAAQVVDDAGHVFVELDGYRTVAFEDGLVLA